MRIRGSGSLFLMNSLANSLFITAAAVLVSIVVHSMIGYVIGRSKDHSKGYNFIYLYIVSGMFVPFAILMALEEAARVDGASTWRTYWKVIFPIMKPMHATVAVLTALGTWNDVMTPLVIMSGAGTGANTLPLAQLNFQTQFGTNYNLAFASYLLALLPILIFYIICQKQILNGVVNGAVK